MIKYAYYKIVKYGEPVLLQWTIVKLKIYIFSHFIEFEYS